MGVELVAEHLVFLLLGVGLHLALAVDGVAVEERTRDPGQVLGLDREHACPLGHELAVLLEGREYELVAIPVPDVDDDLVPGHDVVAGLDGGVVADGDGARLGAQHRSQQQAEAQEIWARSSQRVQGTAKYSPKFGPFPLWTWDERGTLLTTK